MCSMPQAQYGLTDPKSLAEYLSHANIRLVRAECSLGMTQKIMSFCTVPCHIVSTESQTLF